MRVWLVIKEDRHVDIHVQVWLDQDAAIAAAKLYVRTVDRLNQLEEQQGSEQLTRPMLEAGWVYHATTGDDGPRVRVQETTTCGSWPAGSIGG